MAKYTELLSEYIEHGGVLPAEFTQITGFEDLFKLYYYDNEIGSETETLFQVRLQAIAQLKIPIYKQRITELASLYLELDDAPTKTVYTHGDVTHLLGEQNSSATNLPNTASSALPNAKAHQDQITNKDTTGVYVDTYGNSRDELIRLIDELNSKVYDITEALLKEFKKCFMQIY